MRILSQHSLTPERPIETLQNVYKSKLKLPDGLDEINVEIKGYNSNEEQVEFYKDIPKLEEFENFKN